MADSHDEPIDGSQEEQLTDLRPATEHELRAQNASDPAANAGTSKTARGGARKRRDPKEPSAVVGLGASAGGVAVLQQFFEEMRPDSGLAFVVVMHLSPEHESQLAEVIQQKTPMEVVQVTEAVKVRPDCVYVIPPNHQLTFEDSTLQLVPPQQPIGRRVTIDLFFRTLAHAYGQRAVSVILSGTDSDGVIGIKHIRAQGGLTIAQDPNEAEFDSMPASAISTGMIDWVLPVAQMPGKLIEFVENENRMQLPPELPEADDPGAKEVEAPGGETVSDVRREQRDEDALQQVLADLRAQTGQDFSHYKRATILRRIARRLQVNSLETIPQYVDFLRTHPAEGRALLQDFLIGVTHFFRDRDSFGALETHMPQLFAGKSQDDELRVWIVGCATGEEAYSVAIMLCEYCERLENPPRVQIFATDLDEESLADARAGLYPSTIEADVSPERLREFFSREHGRYRVRKEVREKVLFARHNLLGDAPFSRCDLISCRNLLIYLRPHAQEAVFDTFHSALRPGGLLFLGGAENESAGQSLFSPIDAKHRLFVRRSTPRPSWRMPIVNLRTADGSRRRSVAWFRRPLPALTADVADAVSAQGKGSLDAGHVRREVLFGELHLRLLEQYGPPSVVVNEQHDIVHLSESAGRYLKFAAGEPTANIVRVVAPELQIELRSALFKAKREKAAVRSTATPVTIGDSREVITLEVRPMSAADDVAGFFLVLFKRADAAAPAQPEPLLTHVSRDAEEEIRYLKQQLGSTVEQYEAANEELQASNEELQAMNEEMRSATEELETSKEELQSVNEELVTVNAELKSNVEELSRANTDLNNLMASSDVGTIFLDRGLCIQRFTPAAQKIFNLIAADIGRPITDITNKLHYDGFADDVEKVIGQLQTIEREVRVGDEDGDWFLARVAPYRSSDDRISGVFASFINITARKEIEEALREREQFVRSTLDSFAAMIAIIDRNGVIVDVNAAWEDFAKENNFSADNHGIGSNYLTVTGEAAEAGLDEAKRVRDGIQAVLDGKRPNFEYEYPCHSPSQFRWFMVSVSPLRGARGGAVIWHVDITSRKQTEEALRESEERFRLLVDSAGDYAMFLVDPSNSITYWSRGAERIFGWSAEEAIGQSGELIFTPEDREREAEEKEIAIALREGRAPDKRWHLRKDGQHIWVDGVMHRLTDERSGALRGFAKIARDATEERRMNEQLQRAYDDLEQRVSDRTRELQAMNETLEQEMVRRHSLEQQILKVTERERARISQDLHDSLCQELTATAFLLKSTAKTVGKESATAAESLREAAETVNANAGLARDLARGLHPPELGSGGLVSALRELATRTNERITCRCECPRALRVPDENVAVNLYRIAQEAVHNALKHAKPNEIVICVERDKNDIVVSISDDGKSGRLRKTKGGLGIHMMQYRASVSGGTLTVESRRPRGTKVTCRVPLNP